ncbi:uncharacterized protein LOC114537597 [Dendronephthya gigantea]|uniref:uncharacterized protein LOC114537597 n=1 Tax=Dendronephthya gigantea TaxID=151771 RepID=UPI00106D859C|nr:uncharacterized protein LOC114537597 [Dendronephthya gigantea]
MAADAKFLRLSDFSSFLDYFDYYIHDVITKMFIQGGNKLGESAEISSLSFCVMLNTKRSGRKSDVIVKTNMSLKEVEELHTKMNQCQAIKKYLASSCIDQYKSIHIALDRVTFMKDSFEIISAQGDLYGQSKETDQGKIIINYNDVKIDNGLNMEQLRSVLLCNLVAQVLGQKKFKVDVHIPGSSSMVHGKNLNHVEMEYFGISNLRSEDISFSGETESILWDNLLKSPFRTDSKPTQEKDLQRVSFGKTVNDTKRCLHMLSDYSETTVDGKRNELPQQGLTDDSLKNNTFFCEDIWFDLTVFLEHLKTSEQINGYSYAMLYKTVKNINVSPVWKNVLYLEMLKDYIGNNLNSKIVLVCGQEKLAHWQKVALIWRSLTSNVNMAVENRILVISHAGSASKLRVHELLRIRTKQVKQSYLLKYGPVVNDISWTQTITKMAVSVIKLEILLVPSNFQVKLDVTESNDVPPSCRQALFVLYNCARLAKILEKYQYEIDQGTYPPLPHVKDIDFSLLKDQIEWELVLKYVANYPIIVNNVASSVKNPSGLIRCTSSKIPQFLVSLSQAISSYYSRVRILVKPQEHLYPVIFAKLYLIKSLHQVMENALHLLNIDAIDQM